MLNRLKWAVVAFVACFGLLGAVTFTDTNGVGNVQLPQVQTFVTSGTTYIATCLTLPEVGELKVAVRCEEAYVFTYDKATVHGTTALDATDAPVDADTWADHDLGRGTKYDSTADQLCVATALTSVRCWAWMMGASEPAHR